MTRLTPCRFHPNQFQPGHLKVILQRMTALLRTEMLQAMCLFPKMNMMRCCNRWSVRSIGLTHNWNLFQRRRETKRQTAMVLEP